LEAACLEEIEELAGDLGLRFKTPPSPMAAGVRLQAGWDMCVALNAGLSTASRVLVPLASGLVRTLDDVYALARAIPWSDIFEVGKTFSVGATVQSSPISNNRQVALKVKDALADAFRDACGERPNVDTRDPDIRIANSLMDYLFRRMAIEYLSPEERAELNILTTSERMQPTLPGVDEGIETRQGSEMPVDPPSIESVTTLLTETQTTMGREVKTSNHDAPMCMQCGVTMQRAGSCHACPSCGTTSGCS
jgi:hypothetical protein